MSGTSLWTVEHLNAMRETAAAGLLEVSFADGRRLRYPDLPALMAAIGVIERDLAARGALPGMSIAGGVSYAVFERF